jgi:DNA polymerase-3 subunit epsilon
MKSFCVIDTETTGVGPRDRILQVSVIQCKQGKVKIFDTLIHPPVPIGPIAARINGISEKDVRHAPPFSKVKKKVQDTIDNSDYVVAHNMPFDRRMLEKEGIRIPEKKVRDTMTLAKEAGVDDGGDGRVSLDDLARYYHIPQKERRHSSIGDAWTTFTGYQMMIR